MALVAAGSATLPREDDFPIIGTYARDQQCKGNGADPPHMLVKITRKKIESSQGLCDILNNRREGKVFSLHLQCKVPGDHLILGDVTFTIRDEKTLAFEDQDHTSDATLHRCGD